MTVPEQHRKRSGIYYTPACIAAPLTAWAIQHRNGIAFDPSHGGCAFLHAAVKRFFDLSADGPYRRIYGADKDPQSIEFVNPFLAKGAARQQFYIGDFLTLRPEHFGRRFHAVVGNPPYIRHHLLPSDIKRIAAACLAEGDALNRQASYWAYFVLHSLKFVEAGGRLAFVLPGAVLHADYASTIRRTLRREFESVTVLILEDRVFEDAEEESVLVLGENFGHGGKSLRVAHISLKDIEHATPRLDALGVEYPEKGDLGQRWCRSESSRRALQVYSALAKCGRRLGDLADIRIGTVTGANDFFILSKSKARIHQIRQYWTRPILSRSAGLGLELTNKDLERLINEDSECLLLSGGIHSEAVKRYLRKGRRLGIHLRQKCAIRTKWHSVRVENRCDAVLRYMCALGPVLALNRASVACTNSMYAIQWKSGVNPQEIAIGMLSSLCQLSAEIHGRVLGGGLLKLEPSDAVNLVLPPSAPEHFSRQEFLLLSGMCKSGQIEEARRRVDRAFLDIFWTRSELEIVESMLRSFRGFRGR